MPSVFEYLSYRELIRLVICLTIDGIEYIIPLLLTPLTGDIFDVLGLVISLYMFGWIGLISTLELIPGFDLLPVNVITWLIWIVSKRWGDIQDRMQVNHF